jgi:uncharacterized membrane protein
MSEKRPPGKKAAGLPVDFSQPTVERWKSRAWNPDDHRLFTPKTFGWGYGINFYRLVHPFKR